MPGCEKRYTDPSSLRKHIKTHGHYFRTLPSNPASKRIKTSVEEESKPLLTPIYNADKESIIDKKPAMTTAEITSNSKLSSAGLEYVGPCISTNRPQIPYQRFPLPNYLPSHHTNSLQTPLALYPTSEERHYYHPLLMSPSGRAISDDAFALKQMNEAALSYLSPLSHRSLLALSPCLPLPVGHTLLTLASDGIAANSLPTQQFIEVRGNLVHISTLGAEPLMAQSVAGTALRSKCNYTQTTSTQTDLDVKSTSQSLIPSSLPNMPNPFIRQDAPLDLSNSPCKKSPHYVGSISRSQYPPVFTDV